MVGTHGGVRVLHMHAAAVVTLLCIFQVPTNLVSGKLIFFVWPRFRFGPTPQYKPEHMRAESVTQIVDDLFK